MKILVTGFAPFLENATNPSHELARALDGLVHDGVAFHAESPLPVVFGEAAARALEAADRIGAMGILALGLASRSPAIRVETRATNHATSPDPDANGVQAAGVSAVAGAPHLLTSSIDAVAFASALVARGVPAAVSDDPGGYVCNDLYFRLLEAAARGACPSKVLFVHVPSTPHARTAKGLAEAVVEVFVSSGG